MARRKPFKVGDEVVVLNGRKWIAPPARTSVIEEVHPRGVYIRGSSSFLRKEDVVLRTPDAERLGKLVDLLDQLDQEEEEERLKAIQPIREAFTKLKEPFEQEARELWKKVH